MLFRSVLSAFTRANDMTVPASGNSPTRTSLAVFSVRCNGTSAASVSRFAAAFSDSFPPPGVTSVVVDFSSKIWRSEFFATTRLFDLECRKGRLMAWLTAVGGAISV